MKEFLSKEFYGNTVENWAISLGILFGAIIIAKIAYWVIGKYVKRITAKTSAFKVKVGQKVKRGELIGLIGSTGKSTGPHLHYEVVKDGEKVNPIGYFHSDLTPEQYEELLKMSENSYATMD